MLAQQVTLRADAHGRGGNVDVDDIPGRSPARQAEAAPLAHGHELDGIDGADVAPGLVDHTAGAQVDPPAEEPAAAAAGRDEAHVLAVGLAGRPQS